MFSSHFIPVALTVYTHMPESLDGVYLACFNNENIFF